MPIDLAKPGIASASLADALLRERRVKVLITSPVGSSIVCIQILDTEKLEDATAFNGILFEAEYDLASTEWNAGEPMGKDVPMRSRILRVRSIGKMGKN